MTVYLTLEEALRVVEREGIGPVLDAGLLDSALARPRASAFGQDAYATMELKAAALLHSVCKNHALVDGNKRLSWLLTVMFLELNLAEPEVTMDQAYELVMGVADGTVRDVKEIASRLRIVWD